MYSINCKGSLLSLDKPVVMGILNATPDSFVEGHLPKGIASMTAMAAKMLEDGAAILDIGGQSTKPGSKRITAAEECDRVLPVIEAILKDHLGAILSIDTYQTEVARQAIAAGAAIINDISGGSMDEGMMELAGSLQVPYICMHIKGTPEIMQQEAHYENVVQEVLDYFIAKIAGAKKAGIKDLIIDPGFGFAKTSEHNFQLLKNLQAFQVTGLPVLAGLSRKRTIYHTLGVTAAEAVNGTTVLNTMALMNGAAVLRVHDVKEAREAVVLYERFRGMV